MLNFVALFSVSPNELLSSRIAEDLRRLEINAPIVTSL